jgi:hypothetical protein
VGLGVHPVLPLGQVFPRSAEDRYVPLMSGGRDTDGPRRECQPTPPRPLPPAPGSIVPVTAVSKRRVQVLFRARQFIARFDRLYPPDCANG